MTLSFETCIRRTPCILSGHYSIPRGCPLNTGFTVLKWKISPPFHVPQLVNSLLFDISEAWKKVPLSGGDSLHGPLQGLPPASNVPYLALNNKLHETKGKSRWLFVLYHIIGQLSIVFLRLGLLQTQVKQSSTNLNQTVYCPFSIFRRLNYVSNPSLWNAYM